MSDEPTNVSFGSEADSHPAVSVVVVPYVGAESLLECLDSLADQTLAHAIEILVPFREGDETVLATSIRHPRARYVPSESACTAVLRSVGVRHARGNIVAISDDQSRPRRDWCQTLLEAHRRPVSAVGGPVERDAGSGRGWAVFLTDYGRYRPPLVEGPTLRLTDINASYKKWALELVRDVWEREFHEPEVNGALLDGGGVLWIAPTAVVRQHRVMTMREVVRDRYRYGRLFASQRAANASALRRALFVLGTPLLPPLIVATVIVGARRKSDRLIDLASAAPALVTAAASWSWGELCGYLTGRPACSDPSSASDAIGERA